jgi:hypothetical protein
MEEWERSGGTTDCGVWARVRAGRSLGPRAGRGRIAKLKLIVAPSACNLTRDEHDDCLAPRAGQSNQRRLFSKSELSGL